MEALWNTQLPRLKIEIEDQALTEKVDVRSALRNYPHQTKLLILRVKIGITAVVTPFVIFIILSKSADASAKNFAFTTIGTILGYWLSGNPK